MSHQPDRRQPRRPWKLALHWISAAILWLGAAGCGPAPPPAAWQEARAARDAGRLEEARRLLTAALEEDPAPTMAAVIHNDRGVVSRALGNAEQAVLDFEAARRLDERLAAPVYNLAVLQRDAGRLDLASDLWTEAARLAAPDDPRALEYLGLLEGERGNREAEEAYLLEALARRPDSPRILSALGRCQFRRQEPAEAVARWLEALEADPGYAPAYFNLAVVHEQSLGDPDQAAHYWRGFLRHAQGSGPAAELARRRLTARAQDASLPGRVDPAGPASPGGTDLAESPPAEQDRPAEGTPSPPREEQPVAPAGTMDRETTPRREATTASTAAPPDTAREPTTVDGFLERGRRLAGENRDAQGYRDFRRARAMAESQGLPDAELERILRMTVSWCPRQPGAHYDYGLFLAGRGRDDEALEAFRRAVALAPQWVSGYLGLAETAVRTGRYDAAEAALARALRVEPGHREALWGMAVLYDQGLRRHQDAVDAYRSFLSRNPSDARADQARQRIRDLESGPRPEPRPTMRIPPPAAEPPPTLDIPRPRTRDKRTAIEAFNRGAAAQSRGDWSQAIAQYTRALEHDDTFTAAFYNLGVAYHNQGNTDLARDAYRQCIQRDRCHVNSRFNLALLDREQGDPQAAVNQLKELLLCDAQHARSHYVLGLLYAENLNRNDLAATHFRQFLRLSPRDPTAVSVRDWLNTHP